MAMCLFLENFWFDLAKMEPYKMWKGGFIYGFFFERGIYDISPMNQYLIEKFEGKEVVQHLTVSVTDILTGKQNKLN